MSSEGASGKPPARPVRASSAPPWASGDLVSDLLHEAEAAWPTEAAGFLVMQRGDHADEGRVMLRPLAGEASSVSFRAHPTAVLNILQAVEETQAQIIGTYHSHPDGAEAWSVADHDWLWWGRWHALMAKRPEGWMVSWWTVEAAPQRGSAVAAGTEVSGGARAE